MITSVNLGCKHYMSDLFKQITFLHFVRNGWFSSVNKFTGRISFVSLSQPFFLTLPFWENKLLHSICNKFQIKHTMLTIVSETVLHIAQAVLSAFLNLLSSWDHKCVAPFLTMLTMYSSVVLVCLHNCTLQQSPIFCTH